MAPIVKKTYSRANQTSSLSSSNALSATNTYDESEKENTPLKPARGRKKTKKPVPEKQVYVESEAIKSPVDPFDELLLTPPKQEVPYKPLSFWGKKVNELDAQKTATKKECQLYELSDSDDAHSPYQGKKKAKKKPRAQKKQQPGYQYQFSKNIVRKKKQDVKPEHTHEGSLIKERLLLKKEKDKFGNHKDKFTFETCSSLGITSTPGRVNIMNICGGSNFSFLSPVPNEGTPTRRCDRSTVSQKAAELTSNRSQETGNFNLVTNHSSPSPLCFSTTHSSRLRDNFSQFFVVDSDVTLKINFDPSNSVNERTLKAEETQSSRQCSSLSSNDKIAVNRNATVITSCGRSMPLFNSEEQVCENLSSPFCGFHEVSNDKFRTTVKQSEIEQFLIKNEDLSIFKDDRGKDMSKLDVQERQSGPFYESDGACSNNLCHVSKLIDPSKGKNQFLSALPQENSNRSTFSSHDLSTDSVNFRSCCDFSKTQRLSKNDFHTMRSEEEGEDNFCSLTEENSLNGSQDSYRTTSGELITTNSLSRTDESFFNSTSNQFIQENLENPLEELYLSLDEVRLKATEEKVSLLTQLFVCCNFSHYNSMTESPTTDTHPVLSKSKSIAAIPFTEPHVELFDDEDQTVEDVTVKSSSETRNDFCNVTVRKRYLFGRSQCHYRSITSNTNRISFVAAGNDSSVVESSTEDENNATALPVISAEPEIESRKCPLLFNSFHEPITNHFLKSTVPSDAEDSTVLFLNASSVSPVAEARTEPADVTVTDAHSSAQIFESTMIAPTGGTTSRKASWLLDVSAISESISENVPVFPLPESESTRLVSRRDKTNLLGDSLVGVNASLKPGKKWSRSRSLLKQLQDGSVSLRKACPKAKGRQFQTFAEELFEMQPIELQKAILNGDLSKNGTHLESQMSNLSISQCNWANRSVKVVAPQLGRVSHFRNALGLHEVSETDSSGSRSDDTIVEAKVPSVTARDVVLSRCDQEAPVSFKEHFNKKTLKDCKKIGEGVYGEVFMYNSDTVIKIIPIEGDDEVNGEPQKKFEEILSEIVIAMELSNLRHGKQNNTVGFSELKRCWCVIGEYPHLLLDLWDEYDSAKGSENDSPTMFKSDQLYIVLELAHGGIDLEAFVFSNAVQSLSILVQAAYSLAVAEKALEFEHRDLHWGNLLIAPTDKKKISFRLDGIEHSVPTQGVKVSIIDFTLSRMLFDGCSVYNDLSVDPTLFVSQGDYQFEIYRMMQRALDNDWSSFKPATNLYWLHYIVDKMVTLVRYRRTNTKVHKKGIEVLRHLESVLLEYDHTGEFVVSEELQSAVN